MTVTLIIIAATSIISFMAFNNGELFSKLKHYPYLEYRHKEYYRWLTGGFLHGDPMHLIFNMLTLYFFGGLIEGWFSANFEDIGPLMYLGFYLFAIVAASSATFYAHRENAYFASIGASGAVAAVLFAAILLDPTIGIMLFFIPIPIPGFIFGILYLWYSTYAANRQNDNIDHLAHFYGAVFGFFFPVLFKPRLLVDFFTQLRLWFENLT